MLAYVLLLTNCSVIKREKNFNTWKNLALDYNSYVFNNCKYVDSICKANFDSGVLLITNYEFNHFRKSIIDSCLNVKNSEILIMEESGSGEVYYHDLYIFDMKNGGNNIRYSYDIVSGKHLKSIIKISSETDIYKFIHSFDYVKLNDEIKWGNSPITLGKYFVSYTSITNSKLNFVKFISKPIAAAELRF